jgi:hypothetical protein
MKTVPRGDEFAHGKDVGGMLENNRFGRVPKLVNFDIGSLTGIDVSIRRL